MECDRLTLLMIEDVLREMARQGLIERVQEPGEARWSRPSNEPPQPDPIVYESNDQDQEREQ